MAITNGPPSDIPASELWTRLSTAKRPTETVDFPRLDPETGKPLGQIAMRPLTQGEITVAKAEATRKARELIKEKFDVTERIEGYAQVYEDCSMVEILFRACRRPDNDELPVFPTSASARQALTADECAVLINLYAMVQLKLGPIPAWMTDSEMEAWVQRLKEGGSAFPLASLSREQLKALVTFLVFQSSSSPMASSSAGLPPEEPTENS